MMKKLRVSFSIILISHVIQANEIKTSTLKSMPDNATKKEKATVVQALEESHKSNENDKDSDEDEGELSLDCKTWHKFKSEKQLPSIFENKSTFYRLSPNQLGIFIDNERTLIVSIEGELGIMSVIREGFVVILPKRMSFYELKENNLLPGMAGFLQGIFISSANLDIKSTFSFSERNGEMVIMRLIPEGDTSAIFACKSSHCRLILKNKSIEFTKGTKGHAMLIKSGAISDRSLESIDQRCQLIENKLFQDQVNANIQLLSSTCPDLKKASLKKPDIQQFLKACGQWKSHLRSKLQSLR